MDSLLYIVVPCYNEEEVLPETAKRLRRKINDLVAADKISPASRVLFVNDGSKDRTWEMITELHEVDPLFSGISLSRNRGHQNALLAGLLSVREKADMAISMDADLQDDIDAIDKMVDKFHEGCEIVYGVRSKRDTDTFFKRFTAEAYYHFIERAGGEVVFNHADYRLMSRRAIMALSQYEESALFLRGIIPMIGYKTDTVYYDRGERFAGESKYPFKKMMALAVDGITSLSVKPLRAIILTGVLTLFTSLVLLIVFLVRHAMGYTILGWKLLLVAMFFIGGLVLLALGVVGEYAGKTYMESKKRPRFFIDKVIHQDEEK